MPHIRSQYTLGCVATLLVASLAVANSPRRFEESVVEDTPYVATRSNTPRTKAVASKSVAPVNPAARNGIAPATPMDPSEAAYGKVRNSRPTNSAVFADEGGMISELPRATINLETVGKNQFQVETRFDYQRETQVAVGQDQFSFPTQLRYGFADPFEVHVKGNMFTLRDTTGGSTRGFGDLGLGAKWDIAEGAGVVPSIGLTANVGLPTGSQNVSDNAVVPSGAALMQWKLPAEFLLDSNAGVDYPSANGATRRSARFTYGLAARRALPVLDNRLSAFVEMAGGVAFQDTNPNTHQAGTGLSYQINDHFDASTFGRVGLSNAAPNLQTGLGLSWKP